jgi:hypothetical protein
MWDPLLRAIISVMSTTTAPNFIKRFFGSVEEVPASATSVTLRYAGDADTEAIDRLAQLDSRRAPRGVVLVAEVDGEVWAAYSLDDGHTVADPFRPTGSLVALLAQRGRQLRRAAHGATQLQPRIWPKAGYDHPVWN